MNKVFFTTLLCLVSSPLLAAAKIKPIEPPLVTVPAGSFEMGSLDRQSTQPPHTVTLKEFSLGKYEVTVKEFAQFIKATNFPAPTACRHELDGWFKSSSNGSWAANALNVSEFQPVVCINWRAADAYVKWLAKETGRPYRLPSEAEWEYAARAGTKTDYYFGDNDPTKICQYANTADIYGENILQRDANTSYYNWSTGLNNCNDHAAYASIVGMYEANQHGLHDMISNVLEYTADCFVTGYDGAPSDGSARLDGDCERRSARGGSWHWNHFPLAYRMAIPEDFSGGVDGFRIALDGAAPKPTKTTRYFLGQLHDAQQQEHQRRALHPDVPHTVANLAIDQRDSQVTLTWDKSNDPEVTSYRVYRNDVKGQMFKLLATNLSETYFIDGLAKSHQYDYTVVAVKNHLQGMYATPVTTQSGWSLVPGKIEAEWASHHQGSTLSYSTDNERAGHVLTGANGIDADAEIHFQVDAKLAGAYKFEYRVASLRASKGFVLYVNDKKIADIPVLDTGGAHEWLTQDGAVIQLAKGKSSIVLKSLDDSWKLNWIALTKE